MFYVERIILQEDIEIGDDAKEAKTNLEEAKDLLRQNPKTVRNNPKPFLKKMGLLGMPDKILDDIKASLDNKDYAGAERHIVKMTRYIRSKTKYTFMHRFTALAIEAYKKAPAAEKNKIYAAVKSLESKKPIIREGIGTIVYTAAIITMIIIFIFLILLILKTMIKSDGIEGFKYLSIKSWVKCTIRAANKCVEEGRILRATMYVLLCGLAVKKAVLLPFRAIGIVVSVSVFDSLNKLLDNIKIKKQYGSSASTQGKS